MRRAEGSRSRSGGRRCSHDHRARHLEAPADLSAGPGGVRRAATAPGSSARTAAATSTSAGASPSSPSATATPPRSRRRRSSSTGSGTPRTSSARCPGAELARRLSDRFGGAGTQAFLCNSGAEAIEAAIKYACKATGKHGIVALEGSFHGRTVGALSATGQPAKRAAFESLLTPVTFVAARRRRRARGSRRPGHRTDPARGDPGRRRRAAAPARVHQGRSGARAAPLHRRDPDRGRPDRDVLRLRADRRAPGPRDARQGARQRPPDRLPARRGARDRRLRPGRPRLDLRRQPGLVRRRVRRRRRDRRGDCWPTCASRAPACARGWPPCPA